MLMKHHFVPKREASTWLRGFLARVVDGRDQTSVLQVKQLDDGQGPNRLPKVAGRYDDEFPVNAHYIDQQLELTTRTLGYSLERLRSRGTLTLLGMSASAILIIGGVEAAVQVQAPLDFDSMRFCTAYALDNLACSCIWMTKPAMLIAEALGQDPAVLLHPEFVDGAGQIHSADAALRQLQVQGLHVTRSMLAGFVVINQVVSNTNDALRAQRHYKERVFSGREQPMSGMKERVIRLCGKMSDVTALSLKRYGLHIWPVFENASAVRHQIKYISQEGKLPVFSSVPVSKYGMRHQWSELEWKEDFLLRTSTGRRLLVLEADATLKDEALAFQGGAGTEGKEGTQQRGAVAIDIPFEMAVQGYQRVEHQVGKALNSGNGNSTQEKILFRTMRVYLGDTVFQQTMIGAAKRVTVRERNAQLREVDVLIDAHAPLLFEVLQWCKRAAATTQLQLEAAMVVKTKEEKQLKKEQEQLEKEKRAEQEQEQEQEDCLKQEKNEQKQNEKRELRLSQEQEGDEAEVMTDEDYWYTSPLDGRYFDVRKCFVLESNMRRYAHSIREVLRPYGFEVLAEEQLVEALRELVVRRETKIERREKRHREMRRTREGAEGENEEEALRKVCGIAEDVRGVLDQQEREREQKEREQKERDRERETERQQQERQEEEASLLRQLPRLVYHETTGGTVSAVLSLMRAGRLDPNRCMVLLDGYHGVELLREQLDSVTTTTTTTAMDHTTGAHPGPTSKQLYTICAAEIYDDLFRQVRVWARMGHDPQSIQQELDARFLELEQSLVATAAARSQ
jgi:hypothetical protein